MKQPKNMPLINRDSDRKLNEQVALLIEDTIDKMRLYPGSVFPAERKLCNIYKVSRATVREALAVTAAKGIIKKYAGRGHVVVKTSAATSVRVRTVAFLGFPNYYISHHILAGIVRKATALDIAVRVTDTTFHVQEERKVLKQLRHSVAGFLVLPCVTHLNQDLFMDLISQKIPVVFIDRYMQELRISNITTDNEKGGYLAACHLIQAGLKKIAFLAPPFVTSIRDRLQGCRRALQEAGLAMDDRLVRFAEPDSDAGRHLVSQLQGENLLYQVEGIVAGNDDYAVMIMTELKKRGIRIPEDISIVGYDDVDYSQYLDPPLTTVHQPLFEMGYQAMELLDQKIEKGSEDYLEIRLAPELIVRESVVAVDAPRSQS